MESEQVETPVEAVVLNELGVPVEEKPQATNPALAVLNSSTAQASINDFNAQVQAQAEQGP